MKSSVLPANAKSLSPYGQPCGPPTIGRWHFYSATAHAPLPVQSIVGRHYRIGIAFVLALCLHALALVALFGDSDMNKLKSAPPAIVGRLIPNVQKPAMPVPQVKPRPSKPDVVNKAKPKPAPLAKPSAAKVDDDNPPQVVTEPLLNKDSSSLNNEDSVEQDIVVQAPHADSSRMHNPPPHYPRTALRLRQEGTVILKLMVLADGSVVNVSIHQSSGFHRLDEAALEAVKHWHYVPAKRGDENIDSWYEQPVVFTIRN